MTRKKLGLGLLETFSEPCETCAGRGIIIHHDPVTRHRAPQVQSEPGTGRRGRGGRGGAVNGNQQPQRQPQPATNGSNGTHAITDDVRNALAMVAAKTVVHTEHEHEHEDPTPADVPVEILDIPVVKSQRSSRKPRMADADVILDSVLEALPEPKQAGQGRARTSRRAGSAGNVVSAPISED
jgi:ribonuclease E